MELFEVNSSGMEIIFQWETSELKKIGGKSFHNTRKSVRLSSLIQFMVFSIATIDIDFVQFTVILTSGMG